ncbi:SURF1 family protein [Sphingomonas morindae]|uniref:SURF1-like protein n=1 Tax=Sphingomonas morindae TaxID=1541170 RepID=A0ABY4X4P0_9SPHN|nr:SURF1 family protein [Sphingomonas morindae]USI71825.1 SURF1 family protein [Sphingomonas morindae]
MSLRARVPLGPTLLVAAAVALMIGLGVWQLRRMHEKEALLARYAQAATLPPRAFPRDRRAVDALFRRAEAFCLAPVTWRAGAGRDRAGEPGYRHIVECSTGAEGPGVALDMGWSKSPSAPQGWRGGTVRGVIGPDRGGQILLVADQPAPGLRASAVPTMDDIPNNHLAYAVQWFLFAGMAVIIYALVLRRRAREG